MKLRIDETGKGVLKHGSVMNLYMSSYPEKYKNKKNSSWSGLRLFEAQWMPIWQKPNYGFSGQKK